MFETDFLAVESQVSQQNGSYAGLEAMALCTSEADFRKIFSSLDIQTWAELGSGHGLGPLLFAHLNPEKKAIGIEFEKARFDISQKLKSEYDLANVDFDHADLLTCPIPEADTYFFYFPTGQVLDRILQELGNSLKSFKIIAIESHGEFIPRLKLEKWLKVVNEIPLSSARHYEKAVVFEKIAQKDFSLFDLSSANKLLLIKDQSGLWLGESFGLTWLRNEEFQLLCPPRSFAQIDLQSVWDWEQIEVKFHSALRLRRLGLLKIVTQAGIYQGHLRKIYVSPTFKVEISSGEQVEWSHIKQIFLESFLCFDSSSDFFFYPHVV